MNRNYIRTFPVPSFVGSDFPDLELIDMDSSRHLAEVPDNAFQSMTSLKVLNLGSAKIESIPVSIATGAPNLESFALADNKITSITSSELNAFKKLKTLDLSQNPIETLDDDLKNAFDDIDEINLAGDKFRCNCELRWFLDYWNSSRNSMGDLRLTGTSYQCSSGSIDFLTR